MSGLMHIEIRVGGTSVTPWESSVVSCDERRGFDTSRRLSSTVDTSSHFKLPRVSVT